MASETKKSLFGTYIYVQNVRKNKTILDQTQHAKSQSVTNKKSASP